jgi:AcrR family transcriptional regulator
MGRRPAAEVRDHILDTAAKLFDAHGIHAVGLQQIIDAYGCGKNLLYREFASKDELIVAYLRRCQQDWAKTVESAIGPHENDPAAAMVSLVRSVADSAICNGTRGCPLRNTYAEFPDPAHPAHQVAADHFKDVRALLHSLAAQTNAKDPAALADRILLIIDGVYANGATLGAAGAAPSAVSFAEYVVSAMTH